MKRIFNFLISLFKRSKPELDPSLRQFVFDHAHEFPLESWTDLNNDPRCIHCGKYFLDKVLKEQPAGYFAALPTEEKTIVWTPNAGTSLIAANEAIEANNR